MTQVRRLMMGIGLSSLVLPSPRLSTSPAAPPTRTARGDWPMARGGPLRANRSTARGNLRDAPRVWRPTRRQGAGGTLTWDLDDDDRSETCCGVTAPPAPRRARRITWESPLSTAASRSWHSTIWTDGRHHSAQSLKHQSGQLLLTLIPVCSWPHPLADGAEPQQRRRHALREDRSRAPGIAASPCPFPNPGGGELHLFCWDKGIRQVTGSGPGRGTTMSTSRSSLSATSTTMATVRS